MNVIENYFSDMFMALATSGVDSVVNLLDCRIPDVMQHDLNRDFTPQKVKTGLAKMPTEKSLGLDVLSATFFKSH